MSQSTMRSVKLRSLGISTNVPSNVYLEFPFQARNAPAVAGCELGPGESYSLIRRTRDDSLKHTFRLLIRDDLHGFARNYSRGAVEGQLCVQLGHLGDLVDSARDLGYTHPWFNDLSVIRASDEQARADLEFGHRKRLVSWFGYEHNTSFLAANLGAAVSLEHEHERSTKGKYAQKRNRIRTALGEGKRVHLTRDNSDVYVMPLTKVLHESMWLTPAR